jgi:hypothetical protein
MRRLLALAWFVLFMAWLIAQAPPRALKVERDSFGRNHYPRDTQEVCKVRNKTT